MDKPVAMIYHQCNEGIGKLLQCLALAKSLRRKYRPVVLNNGALPQGIPAPDGVEVVEMPSQKCACCTSLINIQDVKGRRRVIADRRDFILQKYNDLKPALLLVDTFPFGNIGGGEELLPLLERAKHSARPLLRVVCYLQDIQNLQSSGSGQKDDRTARLLERFFDMVLVHTDPVFARLEEFFQPKNTLSTPVYHTGFLLLGQAMSLVAGPREERVLVSAGSGATGSPLFRAAIEAHRLLWDSEHLPMTIVTGPLLSTNECREITWLTRGMQAITIKRSVPNLGAEMRKLRWSVSQCGYGTATETISSGVAALFVPAKGQNNRVEAERARRLAHWGAGRLLIREHLNGASLANEIKQLCGFTPRETGFNMSGLTNSNLLLTRLADTGASSFEPQSAGRGPIN